MLFRSILHESIPACSGMWTRNQPYRAEHTPLQCCCCMKKIRLAWDDCFARRNPTGTGVYAAQLLDQLKVSPELDLAVFEGWPEPASGESSIRRKLKFAGDLGWTHLGLPARLRKPNFDVLHSRPYIMPLKA